MLSTNVVCGVEVATRWLQPRPRYIKNGALPSPDDASCHPAPAQAAMMGTNNFHIVVPLEPPFHTIPSAKTIRKWGQVNGGCDHL